jgi:hypothetical protein
MRLLGLITFIGAATSGTAAFWFWFRAIFEGSNSMGGAGFLSMCIAVVLIFLGAIFYGKLNADE